MAFDAGRDIFGHTLATDLPLLTRSQRVLWHSASGWVPLSDLPYNEDHRAVQRVLDVLLEAEVRLEHVKQCAGPAVVIMHELFVMHPSSAATGSLPQAHYGQA